MQAYKNLQPANFVFNEDLQKYVVTIEADAIGFGGTQYFGVVKVLRKANATAPWRSVLFQYEIDNSGNLILYFDEEFTGRVTMITDRETSNTNSILGGLDDGNADY